MSKLTTQDARQIFIVRPPRSSQDGTFMPCAKYTLEVALRYKVTSRTVRDIWNRQSWRETTRELWSPEEVAGDDETAATINPSMLARIVPAKMRKPGRPKRSSESASFKKTSAPCTSAALVGCPEHLGVPDATTRSTTPVEPASSSSIFVDATHVQPNLASHTIIIASSATAQQEQLHAPPPASLQVTPCQASDEQPNASSSLALSPSEPSNHNHDGSIINASHETLVSAEQFAHFDEEEEEDDDALGNVIGLGHLKRDIFHDDWERAMARINKAVRLSAVGF